MSRKVCIVTGSRAEFGLLRRLMAEIRDHVELELQVIATGAHLSPEFGLTFREIEAAGFNIDEKVEMLLGSDTRTAVTKSMGLGLIGLAGAYQRLRPDLVVVLGDRYEIFAAAAAATILGIPIAHIHGGEVTEAAFDDAIRHAVTKMSHLHFVATEEYRGRVIQLGEHPCRVFNVGGLGVDAIRNIKLLGKEELEQSLGIKFAERSILVTFHPVTLEQDGGAASQLRELLAALDELSSTTLIFTMPNADNDGRLLGSMVHEFAEAHENASVFQSLGQLRYLSTLAVVDGVVGNSSSGLTEAPTFKIGTVNIGDRQKGRLKATSVIDCAPTRGSITAALKMLYSNEFQAGLARASNPYGNGGASQAITEIFAEYSLADLLKKGFHDLPVGCVMRGDHEVLA